MDGIIPPPPPTPPVGTVRAVRRNSQPRQGLDETRSTPKFRHNAPVFLFDCQYLLLEYAPEHLLRQGLSATETAEFMQNVFTPDWLDLLLRGQDWGELSHLAISHHPQYRDVIVLFQQGFEQTVTDRHAYMCDWVEKLRNRGYPLYLVGDMHRDMVVRLAQYYDIFEQFYGSILSGDTGERLGDTLVPSACEILGVPRSQCIYVTANPTLPDHLNPMGIKTVLYTGKTKFESALQNAGINTNTL